MVPASCRPQAATYLLRGVLHLQDQTTARLQYTISTHGACLRTNTNTAQAIHCWTPSTSWSIYQSTAGPNSPSLCQVCTAAGKLAPFNSLSPRLYHGSLPFTSLIGLLLLVAFFPSSLLFLNQHGILTAVVSVIHHLSSFIFALLP